MARQRPREIAMGARGFAHVFANHTIKQYSGGIRNENNGGEESFSRRRHGAGREQIRKSLDRVLPGNDGARAFWPEAAKNLPLAVQQFRAGKCPHPLAENPSTARQFARSWRRVRDWESRKAPAWTLGRGRSNPAAGLTLRRECWRCKRRRRRRLLPGCRRPSTSQFRRHLRRSAQGQQYRGP